MSELVYYGPASPLSGTQGAISSCFSSFWAAGDVCFSVRERILPALCSFEQERWGDSQWWICAAHPLLWDAVSSLLFIWSQRKGGPFVSAFRLKSCKIWYFKHPVDMHASHKELRGSFCYSLIPIVKWLIKNPVSSELRRLEKKMTQKHVSVNTLAYFYLSYKVTLPSF